METQYSNISIFKLFIAMINCQGYSQQRAFLKAHRELLDPQYDAMLAQESAAWVQKLQGTLEDWAAFHKFLLVLRYVHEHRETDEAIDTAFVNMFSGFALDIPQWMAHVPDQLDMPGTGSQTAHQRITLLSHTIAQAQKEPAFPPALLASLYHDLARAIHEYTHIDPAQQYTWAVSACQQALQVYSPAYCPVQYAMIQTILGGIHKSCPVGDLRVHQKDALACYLRAVSIYTFQDFPIEHAYLLNDLAGAHQEYIAGSPNARKQNLQQAINYYQAALRIFTPRMEDEVWAHALLNLGYAHSLLTEEESSGDYSASTACFEQVLNAHPSAEVQSIAYKRLVDNSYTTQHYTDAITHYRQALANTEQDAFPTDWASLYMGLAHSYNQYAEQLTSTGQSSQAREALQQSTDCYHTALEVYTSDIFPDECRTIYIALGDIAAKQGSWAAAQEAYQQALEAQERLLRQSIGITSYDNVLLDEKNANTKLALALLRQGQFEACASALEQGRTRWLIRTLGRSANHAEEIGDEQLRQQFIQTQSELMQIQKTVDALEAKSSLEVRRSMLQHVIGLYSQKQQQFDAIIAAIRAAAVPADFLQDTSSPALLLQAARHCGPGHSLVYLAATHQGGLAVTVIRADEATATADRFLAIDLPALLYHPVRDLVQIVLEGKAISGYANAQKGHALAMLMQQWPGETLRHSAEVLHNACVKAGMSSTLDHVAQQLLADASLSIYVDIPKDDAAWKAAVPALTAYMHQHYLNLELQRSFDMLAETAMRPLVAWLQQEQIRSLTLISCGPLASFPLASIPLDARHTVGDLFPTSIAANAASLLVDTNTQQRSGLYAIGDPWPTHQQLAWGEAEALTLGTLARTLGLAGEARVRYQATRKWLLEQALPKGRVVSLSCHGTLNIENVLDSALLLAHNELLLLRDLLYGDVSLQGLRLLILSACQTGAFDVGGAYNEVHSLAACAVQAGAQAVLGTLWSVNDRATYLLMVRFAQEWLPVMETEPPAAALARAQYWLRHVTYQELAQWQMTQVPQLSPPELQKDDSQAVSSTTADTAAPAAQLPVLQAYTTRYPDNIAQKLIRRYAQAQPDAQQQPFASPCFWAGFQVTGW